MNDEKCRVQIMEELLTNNHSWEIEDSDFIRVKDAYKTCLSLLWVEEKFNIVSDNFYEWEQEIKNSYDFLVESQSDSPDCDIIMKEHGTKEIIILNRRLSNILNSIRMYRDQVLHDLSALENELKIKFESETNRQYDKSFSYQLMELVRNYMQHQGLIIERITAIIPFSRVVKGELWYFVESNYQSLKKIDKFKQKIKLMGHITDQAEWINLVGVLREYYSQIIELHNYFRTITNEMCNNAITDINKIVINIYKFLPVKVIAFYGEKNSEVFQDFLLQMTYLERLKTYRQIDIELDVTKYYVGKKIYIESDKIKVSNSIRCNIRFNT
ncbi:MAG: hypothetical protein APF81_08120 [Desulfosporosinus sp. BRH_c37]|nr:MAG: hypothetical protein APF81_08120 [Desulfosporosinus sp. BRH_c37]